MKETLARRLAAAGHVVVDVGTRDAEAHQGVEHDDMNVLVLGARVIGVEVAWELAVTFIGARYSATERHQRRLEKVRALEAKHCV